MSPSKTSIALLMLLISNHVFAQVSPPTLDKERLIEIVLELIDANYVLADRTTAINRGLSDLVQSGRYDAITDHTAFAQALSEDLLEISGDKHFLVVHDPEWIAARRERLRREREGADQQAQQANDEPSIDWNWWYARQENFGVKASEILEGNIGYVRLNFFQPLEWAKPAIDAAMAFVANTDALILDVRDNQGGYSPTDAYLASYFFDPQPTLWSSRYHRRLDETDAVSTFEQVGGQRYLGKPVFVLTSERTFSLAEQLAYGLKHFGKATIVGQVSAGAGHAIDILELSDEFFIQMPILRNMHPVTKTDWEGTGVVPHIASPAANARRAAHLEALNRLIEGVTVGRIREHYTAVRERMMAPEAGAGSRQR